jgi:hypothetical protein
MTEKRRSLRSRSSRTKFKRCRPSYVPSRPEKKKKAKKLAKAKDDLFKVLVDLGLSGVEPAKLKSFLSQHKASLLGTPQAITQPAQSEQS